MYGCLKRDYYIFFGNSTGLIAGVYYTLSALSIMSKSKTNKYDSTIILCEYLFVFSVAFWCLMGMIAGISYGTSAYDHIQAYLFIGTLSCAAAIAYYAAPLSTVAQVLHLKDASSLYAPSIIINLINAFMWFIYGAIATGDPLLWIPNLIGFILSVFEIILILIFSKGHFYAALIGNVKTIQSIDVINDNDIEINTVINPIKDEKISNKS